MIKQKILIVEDDKAIVTGINDLLESEGFRTLIAHDGKTALEYYKKNKPDLILLDIMIPEKSGYEVCKEVRRSDHHTPIIMLTAKSQEVDKVVGLELGADDYVVKPFGVQELLARIRACLRRTGSNGSAGGAASPNQLIIFGDVEINPKTLSGRKAAKEFPVTQREVDLLQYFLAHEGEVIDRLTLLDTIWGLSYGGTTRTLDQHIAKLRQKIEDDPGKPCFILTVHTVGYKFCATP
ncbi:MAG: response regulator transcription factor [Spirochaetales bacterium]|nr:response regulator transcription factor [Spirochaetales bacterium]